MQQQIDAQQENWESLNEKMMITYYWNTQRGGQFGGKNKPEKEMLLTFSPTIVSKRTTLAIMNRRHFFSEY